MYQRIVRQEIGFATNAEVISLPGVSIAFMVGIGLAGGAPEVITNALIKVVDSLKSEPVTQPELARAKAQVERSFIDQLEQVAARADWLSHNATVLGSPERANERLGELMSITAEEVTKAVNEYLVPDNRAVLTFIPGRRPKKEDD
jgi:predicted Zn-dependent peptidase